MRVVQANGPGHEPYRQPANPYSIDGVPRILWLSEGPLGLGPKRPDEGERWELRRWFDASCRIAGWRDTLRKYPAQIDSEPWRVADEDETAWVSMAYRVAWLVSAYAPECWTKAWESSDTPRIDEVYIAEGGRADIPATFADLYQFREEPRGVIIRERPIGARQVGYTPEPWTQREIEQHLATAADLGVELVEVWWAVTAVDTKPWRHAIRRVCPEALER